MFRTPALLRAALVALSVALASSSHAQGLRLTRPAPWSPDSVVKAVITGGSAQLTPDPAVDENVPRIWLTKAERTKWKQTADYEETMRFCRSLEAGSRWVRLESFGRTGQGRDLPLIILSKDRAFTAEAARALGKPIVLIQNGIHSGEIEGKDASLMLVRDLAVLHRHEALLDSVVVLVVPMFSADAHERRGRFQRMNQNGPDEMGWRHTPIGLNLNRDYTKLDAPETRAVVAALDAWQPDLYVDLHVTDGADYPQDITYGWNGTNAHSPAGAGWLDDVLSPALGRELAVAGHAPGPLVFYVDDRDLSQGVLAWTSDPRFSNGYGDLRHLPSVLVENHSLKPYRRRVLGTYVLLETMLATLANDGGALRAAIAADRARRPAEVALAWGASAETPSRVDTELITNRLVASPITGADVIQWTGETAIVPIPRVQVTRPIVTIVRSTAYWIPPAYADLVARLRLHGIAVEIVGEPREVEVEAYRLSDAKLAADPFEGHVPVTATAVVERRRESFPAGSARVATDQPLGDLAIVLLEPASPDSFFQWGMLLEPLQRTEYAEGYILEPMARKMLEENPALRAEFEAKLASDPKFAADPAARLDFFYRQTPFFDDRAGLYPVMREP